MDLTFSQVLKGLWLGERFARKGWNGTGMFIFLVPGSEFITNREPLLSVLGEGVKVQYRDHIDLRAADGTIGMWSPSMTDLLAEDWVEV
jgi:hypothetical protein